MATIQHDRDIALRAVSPRIIVATTVQMDVPSITFVIEQFGARVNWIPVSNSDFSKYELRQGGTSWDNATTFFIGSATTYLLNLTNTPIVVWIKALNTSGIYSTNAMSVTVTVAPALAPAVTYALVGQYDQLNWTLGASANFTLDHFDIRYGGTSWDTSTYLASTKASNFVYKVNYSGARKYWVAGIDAAGNLGGTTSIDIIITPPGSVINTRSEVVDNNALLYWTLPATGSLPIDRYEVRKGISWAAGTVIGSNSDSTFTTIFEQQSGTYTYWVSAFDSAGTSGTPIGIVATINQPPDYVLRQDYNSTFIGTLTNLYLDTDNTLIGPVVSQTWATHYIANSWTTPQNQIDAGYPIYAEPSTTSGSYSETWDTGANIPTSVITATINTTAIVGTVTTSCQLYYKLLIGDSWTAAGSGVASVLVNNFRYIMVTYTFTCTAGANLIKVNSINVKLANKLRTDSGSFIITTASTGITIPFNIPFIDADVPLCQANVSGGGSVLDTVVDFVDTANPTSFTVYLYNSSGTKVTGSGSWTARGY